MITILTPTYNRKYMLPNLYESLIKQTSKDFEWIIIDDGSTDNTSDLISEWSNTNQSVEVRYVFQENGGKHRAINQGVKMAQYNYCFIVDSDDTLTEHAIEKITSWIRTIDGVKSFAGVSGLKGFIGGGQIGGYPKDKKFQKYIDASNLERQKLNLAGDKAEVYRTEILRKYPFPEFSGENFLSEAVVWNDIARDGYKIRWFNEIIYECDYIQDGLTNMGIKKHINNFEGYTYYIRQSMDLFGWLTKQFLMGNYSEVAKQKGLNFSSIAERLEVNRTSLLIANMIYFIKNNIKPIRNSIKYLLVQSKRKSK